VALCDPDSLLSLVMYTIIIFLCILLGSTRLAVLLVCVQLYEADKVSCGLFLLQRLMTKIVAVYDPDSPLSLVIYTSTILV
jgi:hypothetical protein